jgi:hypothetical protein
MAAAALCLAVPLLAGCPSDVDVPLCANGSQCFAVGEVCTSSFPTMACTCASSRKWECTGQDLAIPLPRYDFSVARSDLATRD